MKLLTIPSIIVLLLFVSGCGSEKEPSTIKQIADVDGCIIKQYSSHDYPTMYIAKCGNTITSTSEHMNGKQRVIDITVTHQALAKLTPEEQAALGINPTITNALSKLTDEEKVALGLTSQLATVTK